MGERFDKSNDSKLKNSEHKFMVLSTSKTCQEYYNNFVEGMMPLEEPVEESLGQKNALEKCYYYVSEISDISIMFL